MVYQDFEPDNGTLTPYGSPAGTPPEYGWGFGQAAVGLNDEGDPVHGGKHSFKVTLPAGKPLQAGSGIPAQFGVFNTNFVPECHDRLTFWVWSDPAQAGNHTVMVKFFDQEAYKEKGVSVWTVDQAIYHQWTQLTIPFTQLPSDFNWHRVDKLEFSNYWDGTYYYDDIVIASPSTLGQDLECLTAQMYLTCTEAPEAGASAQDAGAALPSRGARNIPGIAQLKGQHCDTVFDQDAALILDAWQTRAERRLAGMEVAKRNEPR